MRRKFTIYNLQFTIIIAVLVTFFILYPKPYTLNPAFAQTTCQRDTSTNNQSARATGLISTPSLSGIFSNPTGQCIVNPKAAFAPFKIPTYDDLKSVYYDQKSSSSQPPPPTTAGLLAYWKFNEITGTTVKDELGGSNGTIIGSSFNWGQGHIANALYFTGSSGNWVNISSAAPASVKGLSAFSISLWVKPTNIAANIAKPIYYESTGDRSDRIRVLIYNDFPTNQNKFVILFRTGGSYDSSIRRIEATKTSPANNVWYHVVFVFDAANDIYQIYVNGQLEGSINNLGKAAMSTYAPLSMKIGQGESTFTNYPGAIDEVRIYKRALSVGEVQTLYNYTPPSTQSAVKYPPASCKSSDLCQDESYFNAGGAGEISSDAIYYIPGNLLLGQTNPLTSKNNTAVVFVEGNLTIKKDLIYGGSNSGIVFVVKGKINVDPTVTRIDAVLISEGQFCSSPQALGGCKSSGSDQQLTINGSVISLDQPPIFARNLANNSQPAELINHQVKYLVILRNLMSDTLQRWSEIP